MPCSWHPWLAASLMLIVAGCDSEPPEADAGPIDEGVVFPANYADSYREVRGCRANGGSHDFNQIRVVADSLAYEAYQNQTDPFEVGAIVLKEEYDASDFDCSGPIVQWTAMQKREAGNETELNWRWQRVGANRALETEDEPRCYGCHAACVAPDGYDYTCTVP